MRKANLIGSLFILSLSILFVVEAYKMPRFEGFSPGPGFIPFWIGILMVILAFFLLIQNLKMDPQRPKMTFLKNRQRLNEILYISLSLFAYSGLVLLIGYPLSTFLFLFFLLRTLGRYSYKFSCGLSALVTFSLYGLFVYWLEMAFPPGILPIF